MSPLPPWKKGELQIHFIHTGVAESVFFIFPDSTTMLLDCGDHAAMTRLEYSVPPVPGPERLSGDWTARYIERVLPENAPRRNTLPLIDCLMLSHYHADHCGTPEWQTLRQGGNRLPGCCRSGIGLAAETFAFDTVIDRGFPEEGKDPDKVVCHMKKIYAALADRDGTVYELFRLGEKNQIAMRYASVPDLEILNITANGKILCKDGSIRDLYSPRHRISPGVNENGMSLGFRLRYGKFTFFTAGDFSDTFEDDGKTISIEQELAKETLHADVSKINHHGHHSMHPDLVRALSSRAWIANVWTTRHVTEDTLLVLTDRSLYSGDRTIFPGVFPESRIAEAKGKDYLKDIAPETFGKGCHTVIAVPPGGEEYTLFCVSAADETMTVLGKYTFLSKNS